MTPRTSKLNIAATLGACAFAVIAGNTGHLLMSIAILLLSAALCLAIIHKEPQ